MVFDNSLESYATYTHHSDFRNTADHQLDDRNEEIILPKKTLVKNNLFLKRYTVKSRV